MIEMRLSLSKRGQRLVGNAGSSGLRFVASARGLVSRFPCVCAVQGRLCSRVCGMLMGSTVSTQHCELFKLYSSEGKQTRNK